MSSDQSSEASRKRPRTLQPLSTAGSVAGLTNSFDGTRNRANSSPMPGGNTPLGKAHHHMYCELFYTLFCLVLNYIQLFITHRLW